MHAHEALAAGCGLLALSCKQQPSSRLPNSRLHTLIGRIFAAALKGDFGTGGMVTCGQGKTQWDEGFLAQPSGAHVERENQLFGFPLKWF